MSKLGPLAIGYFQYYLGNFTSAGKLEEVIKTNGRIIFAPIMATTDISRIFK